MKTRPGMIARPGPEWEMEFPDITTRSARGKLYFFVTYEEDDAALGYAVYRTEPVPGDADHARRIHLYELVAASPSAEAALWRHVLDIDDVKSLNNWNHPIRSSLMWLLNDPRRLKLEPYDALWLRILDPEVTLASRQYSAPGKVNIEVVDDHCPWTNGTFLLEVDESGGAQCSRSEADPDVTMPTSTLASIYLGAHFLTHLRSAGRAEEHKAGAIDKVDTMFPTTEIHSVVHDY